MRAGPAEGARGPRFLPLSSTAWPPAHSTAIPYPYLSGSVANRRNMRAATALLEEAGWQVDASGILRNAAGTPF